MKIILRYVRYEAEKFIHDRSRLLFTIASLLLLFGALAFVCFFWLGQNACHLSPETPGVWNEELAQKLTAMRDDYYHLWLVQTGQASPYPGEIIVKSDPAELWKKYRFLSFIVDNKVASYYENYSLNTFLFAPTSSCSDGFYLASARLFFYQDLAFMVGPIFLLFNGYFVFLQERSSGFEKNIVLLGTKMNRLQEGKALFSTASLLALALFFSLSGLIFVSNQVMLVFGNDGWTLVPVLLVYFEKWIEIVLVWMAFLSFDILLASFEKNWIYWPLGLLGSTALFPSFAFLRYGLSTMVKQPQVAEMPFWNVLTSDGFSDGKFFERMFWPSLAILVFVLLSLLVGLAKKRHRLSTK